MGSGADTEAMKEEDGDALMVGGDGDYKTATVFPAGSLNGLQKMLTFNRKGPFDVKAQYVEGAVLPPSTSRELGNYTIELPAQAEVKKVKVKAELSLHGTFKLHGAQMVEVEEYEETVKEKRELPPDPNAAADGDTAMKTDGEGDAMKTDGDAAEGGDAMKTDGDA